MDAIAVAALFALSVAVGLVSARLILNAVLVMMMRAAAHSGATGQLAARGAEGRRMPMTARSLGTATMVVAALSVTSTAQAQQPPAYKWNVEFGIGWDNSISGNINSSAIGSLNNQTVVILKNRYEDVYGTGLHLRFGGGYSYNESTEARVTFTFQSLDADLTTMGDYGASRLYGQYSDYQSFGLDVGMRRYGRTNSNVRPYAEGTIGIGFVDKTDVVLVAPQANFTLDATDFYDQTAAFTLGGNVGVLWNVSPRMGVFSQIGIRYVGGMSEVDDLQGTGLETINDKSARWTMPFLVGVRGRF
jgi:hypothetical protein